MGSRRRSPSREPKRRILIVCEGAQTEPGYNKTLDFQKLYPGYADAVGRAQALEAEAERQEEPNRNPTTGVHSLTESIRQGSNS